MTHSKPEKQPPGRWGRFKHHLKMRMYERFSRPRRIFDIGMPDWPLFYLKGTETLIVKARGYIRPKPYIRIRNHIRGLRILLGGVLVIGGIGLGVAYSKHGFIPLEDDLLWWTMYITIAAFAGVLVTPEFMNNRYARWLFKSKTEMIFTPQKIRIKTLSGWKTLPHGPDISLTTRIAQPSNPEAEATKFAQRFGDTFIQQLAVLIYCDTYWVDIIYGAQVVRVTEVYERLPAERLSVGIQTADKIFRQIMEIRTHTTKQAQAVKQEPYDAHLQLIEAMQKRWPK